jgi:NAD(P)-dependent dehydrogenase (short-subunit alcohol dehydrogenase family)
MGLLDGKAAIVTGAGRGIGRAEAMRLAAEGASVVVNDLGGALVGGGSSGGPAHEVAEEIRAAGGRAEANTDDVSDWQGAQRLIDQAISTFGRLDILVNNAGIIRTGMSFNLSESDWDEVIRVHLKGTFAPSRFAGEYWRTRAKETGEPVHASIVNTSSPNGLNGGSPGHVNYAVAKSGIATMTITLARELAPYGVRVNAVAPVANTRMTQELFESGAFTEGDRDRLDPNNIAALVGWLASPLAEEVSGQVFGITGSEWSLWESWRLPASVPTETTWTIDAIDAARARLFGDRSSGVPPL